MSEITVFTNIDPELLRALESSVSFEEYFISKVRKELQETLLIELAKEIEEEENLILYGTGKGKSLGIINATKKSSVIMTTT